MHVCSDRVALPNYVEHPVTDDKADLTTITDQATMGNMEREVLCGITLSLNEAKRLLLWLDRQIKTLEGQGDG